MLAKELSLQTECGYIELVRLSEEDGWMVFDVIYGIPLFADKVAKQVLENMKTFELLHAENIAKVIIKTSRKQNLDNLKKRKLFQHKRNALALSSRLAQFVGESHAVGELPLPSSKIPV